jgi:hypothetical protein
MATVAEFSDSMLTGHVTCDRGLYTVSGRIKSGRGLLYRAADPADQRLAVAGSGLPFANPGMAFDGQNMGEAQVGNFGTFNFTITRPNSYYTHHGIKLVAPHVDLQVVNKEGVVVHEIRVPLGESIPNRSLTSLPGFPDRSTGR